jgi:hypothetical protein
MTNRPSTTRIGVLAGNDPGPEKDPDQASPRPTLGPGVEGVKRSASSCGFA